MKRRLVSIFLACVISSIFVVGIPMPVFAAAETLRPNAVGDETAIETTSEATHWQAVDEAVADDDVTYVQQTTGVWKRDLYNLPASAGDGTVNSITVYYTARHVSDAATASTRASIKTGGVTFDGVIQEVPIAFAEKSEEWAVNPDTEVAWTWADIDDLQIGVSLEGLVVRSARCTQVYVVVDYTAATAPAITLDPATYIGKTTARINSTVDDDGNELCDVRFGYGTTTQANVNAYDFQTAWVERTYSTGEHPFVDVDSLNANDQYFFRAEITNDHSTQASGELNFTTLVGFDPTSNLKAYPDTTTIGLTWTTGNGAAETMIRWSEAGYPADETEGALAYEGVLSSYTITDLTIGHTYYIVAISVEGGAYSATTEVLATTTAESIAAATPGAPDTPAELFQDPDYTQMENMPAYGMFESVAADLELPPNTLWVWMVLMAVGFTAYFFYKLSESMMVVVLVVVLGISFGSLIGILPLWMMILSIILGLGLMQMDMRRAG